MESRCDVAVVGGGPSGSALALALAEKGLDVMLVDKRNGVQPEKHSVVLQPNGLQALEKMDVVDGVLRIGERLYNGKVFDENHELLSWWDIRELDHPFPYLLHVYPDRLTNLLRERFLARNGRLLEGFEFESLMMDGEQVKGIKGKTEGEPVELPAKLVVGADGPFSKVRDVAGLEYKLKFYRDTYLVCHLHGALKDPSEVIAISGRGVVLGAVPFGKEAVYVFLQSRQQEYESMKKVGIENLKRRLGQLEPRLEPALETLNDWNQIAFLKPVKVYVKSWTIPGLALIGDAAHAMNPSTGQGLNLAFVDAVTLSEILVSGKNRGGFAYRDLKKYERLRAGQTALFHWQSDVNSLFLANSRIFGGLANWMLKGLSKKLSRDSAARLLSLRVQCGLVDGLGIREQLSVFL